MKKEDLKKLVTSTVKEMSVAANAGPTLEPVRTTKKIKEEAPRLATGKADISTYTNDEFKPAPSVPNRKSKTMDYKSIWEEEAVNENYARFRNQNAKKNGPEQLHTAIKEIKKKLQEVDRLLEYTQRLKSEITEGSEGFKYKVHTERALEQVTETIKQLYIKNKKLK